MEVIGFAHRGARADAPENTLPAFRLALELGANGLESDVWLTADGVPVLHHGPAVGRWPRQVRIARLRRDELPAHVPRLVDLFDQCGTAYHLSLDIKDTVAGGAGLGVAAATVQVAAAAGFELDRLWLCGRGTTPLAWRSLAGQVRLVSDTRRAHLPHGYPAHLAELAAGGVDAVNLRRRRWTPELVRLVHEAGLRVFAWDAQSEHRIAALVAMGCDAVYSDHVRRLRAVLG